MGIAYAGLDKFEEAIEAYEKAIEINPDNYETYNNMGGAYAGLSEFVLKASSASLNLLNSV
jgi:tetratricopeptide (TPR) repeat protein